MLSYWYMCVLILLCMCLQTAPGSGPPLLVRIDKTQKLRNHLILYPPRRTASLAALKERDVVTDLLAIDSWLSYHPNKQ